MNGDGCDNRDSCECEVEHPRGLSRFSRCLRLKLSKEIITNIVKFGFPGLEAF